MRDRTIGIFRLILTVTGFVLLVVFGSRAAHDASSMKAAGATDGRRTIATMFGIRLLLGLHNPYTIMPSMAGHPELPATAAKPATAGPTSATLHRAAAPTSGVAARRPLAPPTVAPSSKPKVLGAQAVQSAVDKVVPNTDQPVKVLDVPKAIVNDTLGDDITKSLAPLTNNLPIAIHLL